MTITCAECGGTQSIPYLPAGAIAECYRCDRLLARHTLSGYELTLACAAAICLLMPPAVFMPLMDSTIKGLVFGESRLVSSVPVIYSEVWFPFAFGFLFFAFLFPMIRAILQLIVLSSIRWNWRLSQAGRLFRFSEELRIWSMPDVVMIAGVVAYFRASVDATVEIRIGAICYIIVAILAIMGDRSLDRRAVWNAILPDRSFSANEKVVSCGICEHADVARKTGDPCPRCGARLHPNIAIRFAPALAAVAAAIPLCLPAFSAAVIVNDRLTGVWEHTVIGTVQLLADRGFWQYGVIVLVAGVVLPFMELVGIAWLLVRVRFPNRRGLVTRTRVYRMLHRLARWPMIIPFIAALAAPIVDFKGIDEIVAGPGATPLFMIIALVMLAVRLFEPRLMWIMAGEAE